MINIVLCNSLMKKEIGFYEKKYSFIDSCIYVEDIFAEKTDKEKLNASEKAHSDKHGCHAHREVIPHDKLENEINYSDNEAYRTYSYAEKRCKAQTDFCI